MTVSTSNLSDWAGSVRLGINMPFSTRLASELFIWRDIKALKGEDGFFLRCGTEIGLALLSIASIVEGVLRAIFAVLLIPAGFVGKCGLKFYVHTLIGFGINLISIPIILSSLIGNILSKSVCYGTTLSLAKCCVFPCLSKIPSTESFSKYEKELMQNSREAIEFLSDFRDGLRGSVKV